MCEVERCSSAEPERYMHLLRGKKLKKLNCNFIVQRDRFPANSGVGELFVTVALPFSCRGCVRVCVCAEQKACVCLEMCVFLGWSMQGVFSFFEHI